MSNYCCERTVYVAITVKADAENTLPSVDAITRVVLNSTMKEALDTGLFESLPSIDDNEHACMETDLRVVGELGVVEASTRELDVLDLAMEHLSEAQGDDGPIYFTDHEVSEAHRKVLAALGRV